MKKLATPRNILLLIAAIAVVAFLVAGQSGGTKVDIAPADAFALLASDSSIVVLDVRTPAEFGSETGHLQNALLIPVQDLEQRVQELDSVKHKTILVYCRTGHRSTTATRILQEHGHTVRNLTGGITRWRQEQLPVVH